MSDRYSKPTSVTFIPLKAAPQVAMLVFENWILPYGIPNTIITNIGPKIVSKCFAALLASTATNLITTSE